MKTCTAHIAHSMNTIVVLGQLVGKILIEWCVNKVFRCYDSFPYFCLLSQCQSGQVKVLRSWVTLDNILANKGKYK